MQDKKWLWILALAGLSFTANFWAFPVYILDEAKNAACAMEMLQRGDWVTPTFNGELRTDKPPLHYFFMMVSYSIFGVSPFSARLFSVIFGILTVAVVYFFTRRMEGERVAVYASLTLVSSLYFTVQFHLAVPDPYFIFFLTLSWISFAYASHAGRGAFFYVSYTALSMAFMAKGPLAIVLSVIVFVGYLLARRKLGLQTLKEAKVFQGALIFLLIVAPWWVAVTKATNGVWPAAFILGHNVGRFLAPFEGHGSFPGAVLVFMFVALLPLAGFLPGAVSEGWTARASRPLVLLSILAAGSVVAFFIFSKTLLPNYVGPAVPFGAILIGYGIDQWLRRANEKGRAHLFWGWCALIILAGAPFAFRIAIENDRWISDLPELAWLVVPLPAGALLALIFFFRKRFELAVTSYLLSFWLVGILLFYGGVPKIMARNPVASSMAMIQASGREVVGYYFFNSAYVFAMERPLRTFYTPKDILEYSKGRAVIIVTRKNYEAELVGAGFKVVFEQPYLFEGSTALVMINESY